MSYEPKLGYDDGLKMASVGSWAHEKYRIIGMYSELFATGMKYQWEARVCVDLYAGGGYSRVRDSGTILQGSPILALMVKDPFTAYVFCEEDPALFAALKVRARRHAPAAEITFVEGNCNRKVDEIR